MKHLVELNWSITAIAVMVIVICLTLESPLGAALALLALVLNDD